MTKYREMLERINSDHLINSIREQHKGSFRCSEFEKSDSSSVCLHIYRSQDLRTSPLAYDIEIDFKIYVYGDNHLSSVGILERNLPVDLSTPSCGILIIRWESKQCSLVRGGPYLQTQSANFLFPFRFHAKSVCIASGIGVIVASLSSSPEIWREIRRTLLLHRPSLY